MALDVDSVLRRIDQFGPFQIRVLAMFLFIFLPITYQTLIMVFVAYEPPWICTQHSIACLESNTSSARSSVYSTATKPIELYEKRCSLNRSDWQFADYDLYEGPHQSIVNEVSKCFELRAYLCIAWVIRPSALENMMLLFSSSKQKMHSVSVCVGFIIHLLLTYHLPKSCNLLSKISNIVS